MERYHSRLHGKIPQTVNQSPESLVKEDIHFLYFPLKLIQWFTLQGVFMTKHVISDIY